MTFGEFIVIKQADDYISPKGIHRARWLCKNRSNEEIIIIDSVLKNLNRTKRHLPKRNKPRSNIKQKKRNDYEVQEDYVIMYTAKGEPFFVDFEDFWKVKDIYWRINKSGYVVSFHGNSCLLLHRMILNAPDDLQVDHRYGKNTRNDNRKYNLRLCDQSQNERNKGLRKDNKSGCSGVWWDKLRNKWLVNISLYGKKINLGRYKDYDIAVEVRKNAEKKYFGEWSYENSQKQN